jgi:3-methyladenine DNA glycosylase/8-oxoguanine DNA glycosylase
VDECLAVAQTTTSKNKGRRVRATMVRVSGPFSLSAAVNAIDELSPRPERHAPGSYAGWHWIGGRPVLVRLSTAGPRRLALSVEGDDIERTDVVEAESLVRRMFGLDLDAERFYAEAGRDDRVLRRLQSRLFGVRPVAAPTPLAALVWLLLSEEYGPERARAVLGRLGTNGEGHWVAPEPRDLFALRPTVDASRLGIDPMTVDRLRRLGERGLSGAFGSELLRSMPLDSARSWLCEQAEVSGTIAELALFAGAARRDVVPEATPELVSAIERYYGTNTRDARRRLDELVHRWGEFAAWAAYLLIEASRRDGSQPRRAATLSI